MRVAAIETFYTNYVGSKFLEAVKWVFWLFLIDNIYINFLDPLGLYIEPFGLELDEIVEYIILFFFSWFIFYYAHLHSAYGAINGILIYFFLNSLFADIFNSNIDILAYIIYFMPILEFNNPYHLHTDYEDEY